MIFPTVQFAAFFVVVLTLSWALMPHPKAWKPFILGASYVFYGYADWRFMALLAASTIANQLAAGAIHASDDARTRRRILTAIIVFDLGLLGVFKYFDFFIESVNRVLTSAGLGAPLPILAIALPVGISFFTFQAISYVVDVYHRVIKPATFLDFAIYEAFFPHLVAGPIVRAREFLPQLMSPRNRSSIPAGPAVFLIAGGLFKKIVLADLLATRIVDPVFGSPQAYSALEVWVAIIGYAVQIYCDFSAYTDIAIGLALLLGFRFPQNFDRPYAARSLQDFWRRWHMTLSRWLRDYLYIPLGGSRGSSAKTYRNLMLTMLIGGLWHGASWTFVVWGGIHGAGLCLERWASRRPRRAPSPQEPPRTPSVAQGVLAAAGETRRRRFRSHRPKDVTPAPSEASTGGAPQWLAVLTTFLVVCFAWVFFRSPDLATAFEVLGQLDDWGPAPLVTWTVVAAILAGLSTQVVPAWVWLVVERWISRRSILVQGVLYGLFLVTITTVVGGQGVAPFLYFRF